MHDMASMDLTSLWLGILAKIQQEIPPQIYDNWFETALIPYTYENDTLTLDTTGLFICKFISKKYTGLLENAASQVTGKATTVRLIYSSEGEEEAIVSSAAEKTTNELLQETQAIDEPKLQPEEAEPPVDPPLTPTLEIVKPELLVQDALPLTPPPKADVKPLTTADELNSNYTFETFIVGNSNRIAHAAALSIAEAPAQKYNPFFIYGGSGLGKTHLMQAIGHRIRENFPNMVLRCITSEDFANELIQSIQDKSSESFRQRYRNVDVLLVDDIQFLENKEHTQEEFFHTFNKLYQDHKQMVFTSDRPPQDIKKMEDRLRSRFQGGMVTSIDPPDLETRTAILRSRAEAEHIEFQKEAIDYIASNVSENIRELEGAFVRVTLLASQAHTPITLELTQKALQDLVKTNNKKKYITIDEITRTVCQFYKVKYEDLMSKKKTKSIVIPRQIAMYLCRELTENTFPHIGTAFSGRDHTTVMHACNKVSDEIKSNESFRKMIEQLKTQITGVDK